MDLKLTVRELTGDIKMTVNARELHARLEIGKDFSTWIKAQLN